MIITAQQPQSRQSAFPGSVNMTLNRHLTLRLDNNITEHGWYHLPTQGLSQQLLPGSVHRPCVGRWVGIRSHKWTVLSRLGCMGPKDLHRPRQDPSVPACTAFKLLLHPGLPFLFITEHQHQHKPHDLSNTELIPDYTEIDSDISVQLWVNGTFP